MTVDPPTLDFDDPALPRGQPPSPGLFIPGAIVASRYRIVALLGVGGIGEVYRADDLKLGQPVALKFLSGALARDTDRLERLLSEVKLARRVSHPNVCRVFDIGEADGTSFLSMEYIDGEDLGSLLRRIGRLPRAKALDVAQQLCAGLAAAHDAGVLHRDLKPANVMLDGRGRVRITDFGLAVSAESPSSAADRSGTPDYMAPEQLTAGGASIQSDLYALGLVLFEVFTGRHPFPAADMEEAIRLRAAGPRVPGSDPRARLSPEVEKVLRRCLNVTPSGRPASAWAVAVALPGGDPLRAALEAGETLSPERVATAGGAGRVPVRAAAIGLGIVIVGLIAVVWLAQGARLTSRIPLAKSPEVLADRAREVLAIAGHPGPRRFEEIRFEPDRDLLARAAERGPASDLWRSIGEGRPAAVRFVYTRDPRFWDRLTGHGLLGPPLGGGPEAEIGSATVELDTLGRLLSMVVVPAPDDRPPAGRGATYPWSDLLHEAGIDPEALREVTPQDTVPAFAERRVAFEPLAPATAGEEPFRVEGAESGGRAVAFRFTYPRPRESPAATMPEGIWKLAVLIALAGSGWPALRNLRRGEGHVQGAGLLSAAVFALSLAGWLIAGPHVASWREIDLLLQALVAALFTAAVLWVFYIALEPVVRRHWPERIIAWVRLLDGGVNDPLVGRDLLAGLLLGVVAASAVALAWAIAGVIDPAWGGPDTRSALLSLQLVALKGLTADVGLILDAAQDALFYGLFPLALLVLIRRILRLEWMAIAVVFVGLSLTLDHSVPTVPFDHLLNAVVVAAGLVALVRFGILALVVFAFSYRLLSVHRFAFGPEAWDAGGSALTLLLLAALAIHAYRSAVREREAS